MENSYTNPPRSSYEHFLQSHMPPHSPGSRALSRTSGETLVTDNRHYRLDPYSNFEEFDNSSRAGTRPSGWYSQHSPHPIRQQTDIDSDTSSRHNPDRYGTPWWLRIIDLLVLICGGFLITFVFYLMYRFVDEEGGGWGVAIPVYIVVPSAAVAVELYAGWRLRTVTRKELLEEIQEGRARHSEVGSF